MNHEETLEAIKLRSDIAKLDVDQETRDRLLAGIPEPKRVPWDLVSETIRAREEAVFENNLLDNIIGYYAKAKVLAEWKLEEAEKLKIEISKDDTETETVYFERWN